MKKITLAIAAIAAAFTMNAQTEEMVVDHTDQNATSGVPSTTWNDNFNYWASPFVLDAETDLTEIVAFGFQSAQGRTENLENITTGLSLYIYSDDNGKPQGTAFDDTNALVAFDNLSQSDNSYTLSNPNQGTNYIFTVDMVTANSGNDVTLPAGKYWLSIAPTINDDAPQAQTDPFNQWYWRFGSPEDSSIEEPRTLGSQDADWVTASTVVPAPNTPTAMSFTISGIQATASVDNFENIAFNHYLNNNVLTVESNSSIENVTIFNILGQQVATQKVAAQDAQVNVGSFKPGVYLAQVQVEGKMKTFKFVKK